MTIELATSIDFPFAIDAGLYALFICLQYNCPKNFFFYYWSNELSQEAVA